MLDVHPPHEAVPHEAVRTRQSRTRPSIGGQNFFIHVATIVVGLLIAVSFEQTVENLRPSPSAG